ncbi:MAG: metallophosphoesterase [Peptostreptococcaceae bacterium]|nr:metallophosphoesterase [Peptostreptococcaceae bacterium]
MKILIIGDTHGHPYAVRKALKMTGPIDMLIHTGDGWFDVEDIVGDFEIIRVTGNCDRSVKGYSEQILELDGHRIFIVHGHKYNIKHDLNRLYYKSLEENVDIAIFGHTHKRVSEQVGKILFINPGSAWRPRDCEPPGFVVMKLDEGKMVFRFIDLAEPEC